VVVLFFAATFALTVGTDGKLGNLVSLSGKVGVVEVKGVINDSEDVVEALKTFEKAPGVKAIVVRIESPGVTSAKPSVDEGAGSRAQQLLGFGERQVHGRGLSARCRPPRARRGRCRSGAPCSRAGCPRCRPGGPR